MHKRSRFEGTQRERAHFGENQSAFDKPVTPNSEWAKVQKSAEEKANTNAKDKYKRSKEPGLDKTNMVNFKGLFLDDEESEAIAKGVENLTALLEEEKPDIVLVSGRTRDVVLGLMGDKLDKLDLKVVEFDEEENHSFYKHQMGNKSKTTSIKQLKDKLMVGEEVAKKVVLLEECVAGGFKAQAGVERLQQLGVKEAICMSITGPAGSSDDIACFGIKDDNAYKAIDNLQGIYKRVILNQRYQEGDDYWDDEWNYQRVEDCITKAYNQIKK